MYVEKDKKRVSNWEKRTGLYLPVGSSLPNSTNIISSSAEKVNEDTTKFSMRDSEYLEAVKNNDMETAQRLVDEYAEEIFYNSEIRDENRDLLPVYHARNSDFNIFDKSKSGNTTYEIAEDWAVAATANLGFWFHDSDLKSVIGTQGESLKAYINIENAWYGTLDDVVETIRSYSPNKDLSDEKYRNKDYGELKEYAQKFVDELTTYDYDGMILDDSEFGGLSYVAFESSQIKSADPVTYDDDGNVIPLSERFNEDNNDIRYQSRNTGIDEDIEELLFDEEFYKPFENEDKTVITESLSELQTKLENMNDDNSTWEEEFEIRIKIKALKEGYKSPYDYFVGKQKKNIGTL